jgi:hypothetical protein
MKLEPGSVEIPMIIFDPNYGCLTVFDREFFLNKYLFPLMKITGGIEAYS